MQDKIWEHRNLAALAAPVMFDWDRLPGEYDQIISNMYTQAINNLLSSILRQQQCCHCYMTIWFYCRYHVTISQMCLFQIQIARGVDVWRVLSDPKSVVFICGDARAMAPDVKRSFQRVIENCGGRSNSTAANLLASMVEAGCSNSHACSRYLGKDMEEHVFKGM